MDPRATALPNNGSVRPADDAVEDLLAMVSHEVEAPLAEVAATVEALLGNFDEIGTRDARAMLAGVHRSTAWLQALVENLSVAAQFQTGQLYLAPAPVPLAECLQTALALVQPVLEAAGARVILEEDPSLEVRADARRVEQVLVNLLLEASNHGRGGRPIWLKVERAGAMVRVWVEDRGPRIGPEVRGQDFGWYRREKAIEEPVERDVHRLGLTIVQTLIERQGGKVGAEDCPGYGPGFWFTLPLARDRSARVRKLGTRKRSVATGGEGDA